MGMNMETFDFDTYRVHMIAINERLDVKSREIPFGKFQEFIDALIYAPLLKKLLVSVYFKEKRSAI